MRMSTVREFRDNATSLLRSRSPILITRRGRLAGIFFPRPEASLPVELKKELTFPLQRGLKLKLSKKVVLRPGVFEGRGRQLLLPGQIGGKTLRAWGGIGDLRGFHVGRVRSTTIAGARFYRDSRTVERPRPPGGTLRT